MVLRSLAPGTGTVLAWLGARETSHLGAGHSPSWPCCASPPASASAAAPPLTVKGKRLVNARTGQAFVPRGVNWPASSTPASTATRTRTLAIQTPPIRPPRAPAKIASWKINTVRVPLNQACWLGEDGQPAFGDVTGYRAAVQDWISSLHDAGLAVIVDLHWSAPTAPRRGPAGDAGRPLDDLLDLGRHHLQGRPVDHLRPLQRALLARHGDTTRFDLSWDCWSNGGCAPPVARRQPAAHRRHLHGRRHADARGRGARDRRAPAADAGRARLRQRPQPVARPPARGRAARRELPQLPQAGLQHRRLLEPRDRPDRRSGPGRDRRVRPGRTAATNSFDAATWTGPTAMASATWPGPGGCCPRRSAPCCRCSRT